MKPLKEVLGCQKCIRKLPVFSALLLHKGDLNGTVIGDSLESFEFHTLNEIGINIEPVISCRCIFTSGSVVSVFWRLMEYGSCIKEVECVYYCDKLAFCSWLS